MLKIKKAKTEDASILTLMVVSLLSELSGEVLEQEKYNDLCVKLLNRSDFFTGFLAFNEFDHCIGILTVTETCSIYAGGCFGVIQELYVLPEYRSMNIGHELIKEVVSFAESRAWRRIEVGAPDRDKWVRTIKFYEKEGFEEIGPRLKLVL